LENNSDAADLFVSHAHYDHARGFESPVQKRYSTRKTGEICETDNDRKTGKTLVRGDEQESMELVLKHVMQVMWSVQHNMRS
jgi:metal-dependent hydrolase (beta-lactamase superfamily II)